VSSLPSVLLRLATSPSPSPSLSQSSPTSPLPGESDATWLGPGLLGFLSLLFLAVALYFIYRGLTKQLKRVTFDEDAVNADVAETAHAAPSAGAAGTTTPATEPVVETPASEPPA
jgi:hypothetical protein